MTKPWESPLQMNSDQVRALLKERLPEPDFHSFQKLDQGWDNDIYLVNGQLIVRIARRPIAIPLILTEIRVLPVLQPLLSFPIPAIEHSGIFTGEYPFFSYPMLPGTIAADLTLNEAERASLVVPLTDCMNELHTIPLSDALRSIVPGDEFGRLDLVKRTTQINNKIDVTTKLGIEFDRKLLADLYPRLSQHTVEQKNCLVHGDLYARNILLRDRNTLSGIIDWGDIHIGHPAKDVAFAVSFFGPEQLQGFIDRYHLFDATVFYLAILAAISHTCHLAEYAIDIKNELLAEECRTIFRNVQQNYAVYGY